MSHHRYDHSSSSPTFSTKPNRSLFIKRVPFQTRYHFFLFVFCLSFNVFVFFFLGSYHSNLIDNQRCQDLRSIFEEFGSIKDVYIPRDYYTGRIRGFAYVEYPFLMNFFFVFF